MSCRRGREGGREGVDTLWERRREDIFFVVCGWVGEGRRKERERGKEEVREKRKERKAV